MAPNGTIGLARAASAGADLTRELDELLRRRLGIADVHDVDAFAAGLERYYPREALRIAQETQGFSIGGEGNPVARPSAALPSDTPGAREYRRVKEDLAEDLAVLVSAPANREWKPELQGWRATMLRTLDEGAAAARLARDPARRDAAFLAVRTLNEYARVARLIGVVHLRMHHDYRRFARTLDEGASAIRVLAGEALYDAGLADGGLILSVPVTDLRLRGDAVVAALRGLLGLEASGPEDTGENLQGYNMLLRNLVAWGETELAGYLREGTLQQAIDAMVEGVSRAVGRSDAQALREIAATLPVAMRPFRRLMDLAGNLLNPPPPPPLPNGFQLGGSPEQAVAAGVTKAESPALSRFAQALNLFLQCIDRPRQGARLVDLAVPLPIAALQTYEADGDARATLRELVNVRAEYAREADEYLSGFGNDLDDLRTQVRIDMLLQHLDRAVDLIAIGGGTLEGGADPFVRRAAIVGILAVNLSEQAVPSTLSTPFVYPPVPPTGIDAPAPPLGEALPSATLTASTPPVTSRGWQPSPFRRLLERIWKALFKHETRLSGDADDWFTRRVEGRRVMPPSLDPLVRSEMLRMHHDETRWQGLVQSLAPRTTRGSRFGRDLLQAGWDLLAYNTNEFAFRQEPLPAVETLRSAAGSLRNIDQQLAGRFAESGVGAIERDEELVKRVANQIAQLSPEVRREILKLLASLLKEAPATVSAKPAAPTPEATPPKPAK